MRNAHISEMRSKYVIIDFVGRDTCKVVYTLDGKTYIRNVKFLTRAPIVERALIFDDMLDNIEVKPKYNNGVETDNSTKDTVIRTRSGRVSKSTRSKDFEVCLKCLYWKTISF
jgi:hypothetical protein